MQPWELEAREAIRDLIARYNQLADRGRVDEVVTLFCEDGVLESRRDGGEQHRGRDAIARRLRGGAATPAEPPPRPRLLRHHVSSILFESVEPDVAHVASYFAVLMEGGLDHFGRYRDVFAKVEGAWLLRHRIVRRDWTRPSRPHQR